MTEPISKIPKYTTSDDDDEFFDCISEPQPIKRQIRTVYDLVLKAKPKVMKPNHNLRIQLLNRNLWNDMRTFVSTSQNSTAAMNVLLPGHDFYQYYDYPPLRTIKPRQKKRF